MHDEEVRNAAEQVIEFLNNYPEVKNEVIGRLVEQKRSAEQQKVNKEIKKRVKKYRKLMPGIFAIGFGLGAFTMAHVNNGVTFPVDNEIKYESIEEAPTQIQEAYVGDQYSEYISAVDANPNLENETFVNSVREFGKLVSEGADDYKIDEVAKNINNATLTDEIDKTIPFESTSYAKSIVEDETILEPIEDKTQIENDDQIIVRETGIYRRR